MPSRKETAAGIVGVSVLAKSPAARRALVGLLRQGGRTLGPWGIAAWLAYEGYIRRDQLRNVANETAERLPPAAAGQGGDPTFGGVARGVFPFTGEGGFTEGFGFAQEMKERREDRLMPRPKLKKAANKFQKAVSKAYTAVKKTAPKLSPTKAFNKATKIASRANPATKSKIGKGKSFAQKQARKIRKSIWGVTKRLKR